MYSEGIFDISVPEVHQIDNLPTEVFLLKNHEEIGDYFRSKKDLALCSLTLPHSYDSTIKMCLDLQYNQELESKNLQSLQQQLTPLSKSLLSPILEPCMEIEHTLQSRLRLTIKTIRDQMCPLFHVDRVIARTIVTLTGTGTQWLQEKDVNRKNLGKGGRKPIAKPNAYLQQVLPRQLAILKGSRFKGSKGLVHRSPPVSPTSEPRLLIRMDFI